MGKPERLQKIISAAGVAARRKAEVMILAGRVSVNGQTVTQLGTRADPERDSIRVDGKAIRRPASRLYILLNKPRRVICTLSDPQGRTRVTDLVKVRGRVYPVGRLDYDTEGLILLTNDGAFSRIVGSAGDHFPKVYEVKVKPIPDEDALDRLRAGIHLRHGTKLAPCKIRRRHGASDAWLEVTLTEGRNRQIRRMFETVGCTVSKLRRTRLGFLTAHGLPAGTFRMLTAEEVAKAYRLGSRVSRGTVKHDSHGTAEQHEVKHKISFVNTYK